MGENTGPEYGGLKESIFGTQPTRGQIVRQTTPKRKMTWYGSAGMTERKNAPSFLMKRGQVAVEYASSNWSISSRPLDLVQIAIHHKRIDEALIGMLERAGQTANGFESKAGPEIHSALIGAHYKIELHGAKAAIFRALQ